MGSNIGFRIDELIKSLEIKKNRFAERLGVDQSYITKLTKGISQPSDLLITSICREFHVDEIWLRTGEGEMFQNTAQDDQLQAFLGEVMHGSPDFRRRLISVLSRMTPEEWAMLERKAWELVGEMKKTDPEGPAQQ